MDPPERTPLKIKLKDHWNTRDQMFNVRPETANRLGISFFWTFTASLMFTSLWVVIPELNRIDSEWEIYMQGFVWWIFFQSVINWVLCIRTDTSVGPGVAPPPGKDGAVMQELPPDWHHCSICNQDVPPRAAHCRLCKACILKKDHHCYFTGYCVGFHNQRRFIVFIFYIFVGSVYGVYLIFRYLQDPIPLYTSDGWSYIACIALWKWVFGYLNTGHFILILQIYFALATMIASAGFFIWEMGMTYRGQTTYELNRDIHRYRSDIMTHYHSVFGPFGLIQFFLPLPIKQEGDGIIWPRKALKAN